jgi:hypothetical protein
MDDLIWLTRWYTSQCNGSWEHQNGIKLYTLDNPGWTLRINLYETNLETRSFADQRHGAESGKHEPANAASWWSCRVEGMEFRAACGPHDLPAVFSIFRNWAENSN